MVAVFGGGAIDVARGGVVGACGGVGMWAGQGGEVAKFWLPVLTEIKNRGVEDVCNVVSDGLSGLPDAIEATWRQAITQSCVLHLLRASFRYASKRCWPQLARDLKPIYTAPTAEAARERLAEFAAAWEDRYPAIVKLWERSWEEFSRSSLSPSRPAPSSTAPTPSRASRTRFRRSVNARGHFPNEQAALKAPLPRPRQDRPHRARTAPLGDQIEARTQRICYHVGRPHPTEVTDTSSVSYTEKLTVS
ncbi:MAG: hypothetical protein GEV08_05480 [Acidimicrobiia bacterium]|nr:hypothetical protein [Acidimicrobiia bacterium]